MDILLTANYKIRHLRINDKVASVLQTGSPLYKNRNLQMLNKGYFQKFSSISKTLDINTNGSSSKVITVKKKQSKLASKTIINQVSMYYEDQRVKEIDD